MRILFVTVNRSDYGIWRPVLRLLKNKLPEIEIGIFATGGHQSGRHGNTLSEIETDKFFNKLYNFPCTMADDSALGGAASISFIPPSLGFTIKEFSPDMIFVLGDRYEVLAAALSISLFRIPIVHFHGGSITEGAVDDNFRHAITKLSHYHFVECLEFKQRLVQLGEDKNNIFISGAPSLNLLKNFKPQKLKKFQEKFLKGSNNSFILATLHTETTKSLKYNKKMAQNFFAGLDETKELVLVTAPNPDPNFEAIFEEIELSVRKNPNKYFFIPHLGHENYFNAIFYCKYLVGNSSSGIIEASSFKKLVLNVGERQKNRAHDCSVIHCGVSKNDITKGLKKVNEKIYDKKAFLGWKSIYFKEDSEEVILKFFETSKKYYQKIFKDMDKKEK